MSKKIKDTQAIRVYIPKTGGWCIQPPKSIEKRVREYLGVKKQTIIVAKSHLELLNALELMRTLIRDVNKT